MTDGPRPGATETFARTRTECSERPLPEPSSPPVQQRSLSRRGRTAFAITGVALASLLMAASVGCGTKTEAPTSPSPSPSATASAEATPPADAEMTSQEIDRLESYAAAMEKYKNMDVATFEALPRSERLLYAQYLMDNSVARGEYSARYGKYAVKNQQELAINPVEASLDNTGQEIVDGWLFRMQISYVQNNGSSSTFDVTPGREALSAAYYNVGVGNVANEYNAAINMQATLDKPTPIGNKNTVTDTSELLSGKNSQSETVKYKIVTFLTQDNQPLYATFVFDKFKRYDGPEETIWLKEAQSGVSVNDLKTLSAIR